jgi:peptide/nickel transport system permease protein
MPDQVPESTQPGVHPGGACRATGTQGGARRERGAARVGTPSTTQPSAEALEAARQGLAIKSRSQFRMAADRFFHHRMALAGLGIFVFLLLVSTIVPLFWKYSYSEITGQYATAPSLQHPFGTDPIGHDMFAQVLHGTATTIKTGP